MGGALARRDPRNRGSRWPPCDLAVGQTRHRRVALKRAAHEGAPPTCTVEHSVATADARLTMWQQRTIAMRRLREIECPIETQRYERHLHRPRRKALRRQIITA